MSLQTITQILQAVSAPLANPVAKNAWDDLVDGNVSEYNIDPLACSVACFRTNKHFGLINNKDLVTEDDIAQANIIRSYYLKKYFWQTLSSDRPQSEYRINAQRLLSIERDWKLTDKEAGLFVKLPAFYAEDTVYDKFVAQFKTDIETYKGTSAPAVAKKLTYLDKTFRWQRVKRVSYWFTDGKYLFNYTTAADHPFNALFEDRIQTPQVFEFSRGVDRVGAMWHNTIRSFTIQKEQNA